jgi:hypothetical protein
MNHNADCEQRKQMKKGEMRNQSQIQNSHLLQQSQIQISRSDCQARSGKTHNMRPLFLDGLNSSHHPPKAAHEKPKVFHTLINVSLNRLLARPA